MVDVEKIVEMWMDGTVLYPDLPEEAKKAVDAMIDNVEKGDPTMYDVNQGGVPAAPRKKKKKAAAPAMPLVHKSQTEHRFTLGPWYIPNKPDAHDEWTDADELQKALWDYVRTGDRDIRLQHNKDIVAGEWVEAMSFPIPISMEMKKSDGSAAEVTYPEGTVFLGVQWKPWAWELVKEGKITGFSIGGNAARIEMGIPTGMQKKKFGGDRSQAGAYAARIRWRMATATEGGKEMDYPTSDMMRGEKTRTISVGGKDKTFNLVDRPASDAKVGDMVSTRGGFAPVKVIGTTKPETTIGGKGTISLIVQPVGSKNKDTLSVSPTKKLSFWEETTMAKTIDYAIVPLGSYVGKSKVRNVAGIYGPDGEAAIVRTDGERYWATGHSHFENMPFGEAQALFAVVAEKARFKNRSEAGKYAADIRWARTKSGVPDGTAPKPKTAAGKAVQSMAPSLLTHCDLDAVGAEMKAAGLKEPTGDMLYKHLTPERRDQWDSAIAEKLNGVPTNPNGPDAYMMGGGAASGKSSAIRDGAVSVPNADKAGGPVKAVDVNPDSAKEQLPAYNNLVSQRVPVAASYVHEESSAIAALTGNAGLRSGRDIVVDGVANNGAAKTIGKTDAYREAGAKKVILNIVTVDIASAKGRADARGKKTGRVVDSRALVNGHVGVSRNFDPYLKSGKWDQINVIDTNGPSAKLIFKGSGPGKGRVLDKGLMDRFIAKKDYTE